MQWVGLGKVTVATAGTPIPLVGKYQVTKVNMVQFTYDPADSTAIVYVKDRSGNIMAAVTSGAPLIFTAPGSNQLNLIDFQVDAGSNSKGPYVALGVD
jgi:hypothetical protein